MLSWASWAPLDPEIGAFALENLWKAGVFTYIPMESARVQNTDVALQWVSDATKCGRPA